MRFSELDGLRIGVWGLGSEIGSFAEQAARHLPRATITVAVEDRGDRPEVAFGAPVIAPAAAVAALTAGCDVLVRSPGVTIHRAELRELRAAGMPIATATGLWLAERGGRRVIGISATKGKSTTATMLAKLLGGVGEPVELAGNIGRPALELLDAPDDEWAVVELSSYQIADLAVGPQIAMLTNLYKEHVNWHLTEETYRREKLRLLELPEVEVAVTPAGHDEIAAAAARGSGRIHTFGSPTGWHLAGDEFRHPDGARIPRSALRLRGRHNAVNLCAALAAADAIGATRASAEVVATIDPLPHRLEPVHVAEGVEWVDDSISTTPESAIAALEAYPDVAVVLIGGGEDRGQQYEGLAAELAAREAAVIGLPTTGGRLVDAARAAGLPVERAVLVPGMEAAVPLAKRILVKGGVVLLSPAAPSYDTYKDFVERGNHFAALARSID